MQFSDEAWKLWAVESYPPSSNTPPDSAAFGTSQEPESSLWLATLSAPFGESYKEGVKVLDYGCGVARYFNFLSKRLVDFKYYGIEPKDASPSHGPPVGSPKTNLDICREAYGHDSRAQFGAIGSEIEKKAIQDCDFMVAGSIFTHLPIEIFDSVVDKFTPAMNRGAKFIFTVFISNEYSLDGNDFGHGIKECYNAVKYTKEQIDEISRARGLQYSEVDTFNSSYVIPHSIMVMGCA